MTDTQQSRRTWIPGRRHRHVLLVERRRTRVDVADGTRSDAAPPGGTPLTELGDTLRHRPFANMELAGPLRFHTRGLVFRLVSCAIMVHTHQRAAAAGVVSCAVS